MASSEKNILRVQLFRECRNEPRCEMGCSLHTCGVLSLIFMEITYQSRYGFAAGRASYRTVFLMVLVIGNRVQPSSTKSAFDNWYLIEFEESAKREFPVAKNLLTGIDRVVSFYDTQR